MREIFIKHYIDQFGLSSGKDYIINLKERIKICKNTSSPQNGSLPLDRNYI